MTNRILISSNTISYVVYNIFISLHIEMFFNVANVRAISSAGVSLRERTACTIWLFSSSCFCFSSSRILACHSAAFSRAFSCYLRVVFV